jgi:hypothetical protein
MPSGDEQDSHSQAQMKTQAFRPCFQMPRFTPQPFSQPALWVVFQGRMDAPFFDQNALTGTNRVE